MVNHNILGASNVIEEFKKRADAAGVSLHRIFIDAKHDRDIISRWRFKEPKALKVVRDVDAELRKYEVAKPTAKSK